MSDAPELHPFRATLSSRWQVPVFGVGVMLFGGGLIHAALAYQPITFEEQLAKVETLHKAEAWERATAYLLSLLKDTERPAEQRGILHRLVARTTYFAERGRQTHHDRNLQYIVYNYQAAGQLGMGVEVDDWIALGDTYFWRGDSNEAILAYRKALELEPPRPDRLWRRIIELELEKGRPVDAEMVAEFREMLDIPAEADGTRYVSSPSNYLWALEHLVDWLLGHGEIDEAQTLVAQAQKDLAGTSQLLPVSYLDALCLFEVGEYAASEAVLRTLLDDWLVRDDLWGRSLWLLGRIQQQGARPQAALSFFSEALDAFQAGDVYDACELGRAECLAMLERYERALEMFGHIRDRLLKGRGGRYLDRDAVRMTATTIGDRLLKEDKPVLAIGFFRLALSLVAKDRRELQARYLARIAGTLSSLAEAREAVVGASLEDREAAESYYQEAAEEYLRLAELETMDEVSSARHLVMAADNFEAAGLTDRVTEVLALFIEKHKTSDRRADVLYRLGMAHQAAQRYEDAIAAYGETIGSHRHMPAALRSIVPLAECLIQMGGDQAKEGVRQLVDIVDDRGPEPLFSPEAKEYKAALYRLIDYYTRAGEEDEPAHFEEAIRRLETAIAFYPDDTEIPRLKFMLADAYRRSSLLLGGEVDSLASPAARETARAEARRRLQQALEVYGEVITALARYDTDSLSDLERTHLRASYLYRGDCLLDLGEYEAAVEAYREAVWRYENHPTAVAASMQIVHCFQRLGRPEEARAALARLKWLLRKIPESSFDTDRGMSSKAYWETMVARLEQTGLF